MKRSRVQFQKGLSLQQFLNKYGQEEQCQRAIFRAKWPNGWICQHCGSIEFYTLKIRLLYQCKHCRSQPPLISGTIFTATKLPLTTSFLPIFFITQAKEGIAALNLRRFLGISDTAALRLKHKLQSVMKNADDTLKLHGLIQINDVYLGGQSSGGKRGRGATGKSAFCRSIEQEY